MVKRFSSETLLRIRKRQEDIKAMDLAAAQRAVREAEGQRERLAREQRRALGQWAAAMRETFDASDARRYQQYERQLARMIDDKDASIRELERMAGEKRGALLRAVQQKRIVEKLQERQSAAYDKEQQRIEQRERDEVATNYAARRLR